MPFPIRESELVTWTQNLSTRLSATPLPYGVTVVQAAAYQTLSDAFVASYATANNDGTRTRAAIAVKNADKKAMLDYARMLSAQIEGNASVTDAQKLELGLTVRKQPSRIDAPTVIPTQKIVGMDGWTVSVQLRVAGSNRRGLPAGCAGAYIYSFVGAVPPSDPKLWDFEGATTRADFKVAFPAELPEGTKVYVCSCYFSPRQQTGPACGPTGLLIGGGVPETSVA